jgi:hypothetical protein
MRSHECLGKEDGCKDTGISVVRASTIARFSDVVLKTLNIFIKNRFDHLAV